MPRASSTVRGRANRLIDDLVHPYFRKYPALVLLDGLLHAAVEGNPEESLRKFAKYNVPRLLRYVVSRRR